MNTSTVHNTIAAPTMDRHRDRFAGMVDEENTEDVGIMLVMGMRGLTLTESGGVTVVNRRSMKATTAVAAKEETTQKATKKGKSYLVELPAEIKNYIFELVTPTKQATYLHAEERSGWNGKRSYRFHLRSPVLNLPSSHLPIPGCSLLRPPTPSSLTRRCSKVV